MKVPEQCPVGYACVAVLGVTAQLGSGLQEKGVVKLFRVSAGKIQHLLPAASR